MGCNVIQMGTQIQIPQMIIYFDQVCDNGQTDNVMTVWELQNSDDYKQQGTFFSFIILLFHCFNVEN